MARLDQELQLPWDEARRMHVEGAFGYDGSTTARRSHIWGAQEAG